MTHDAGTSDDRVEVALDVLLAPAEPSDAELTGQQEHERADQDLDTTLPTAARRGSPGGGTGLTAYLAEISRIPLLDASQEVALAQRVQDGLAARALLHSATEPGVRLTDDDQAAIRAVVRDGQVAAEQMTQANLRLVVSIARHYRLSGEPLLDLIQDGNLGLMRAVEKFDPARGFKFSTYASWWIRQGCSRGSMLRRHVRLPDEVHWQIQKLRRTETELSEAQGSAPSTAQLAEQLDLPVARVVELRALAPEPVSLSLPLAEGSDATLGDVVPDDRPGSLAEQVVAARLPDALNRVLATLPDRQRRVLELRFGFGETEPQTLDEIARQFGVTSGRVRQLEVRAMTTLRRDPDTQQLRDWVTEQ